MGERGREEHGGRDTFFFERRESSERFNNNIPLQIFGRPFNLRAARRRMRRARGAASAKGAGEKNRRARKSVLAATNPRHPPFSFFPLCFLLPLFCVVPLFSFRFVRARACV